MLELHLHLDGSLRPESVWDIADSQNINTGCSSLEEIRDNMICPPHCPDLTDYLKRFDIPILVFQKESNIERFSYELVEDLAKEGLEYAEIRFAPSHSVKEGLSQEAVVEAVISGINRGMKMYPQIKIQLILCCMRGDNMYEANMNTINVAKTYYGKGVAALDLAGAEALFPTDSFRELFDYARSLDIPYTIHAGEAAGPESVISALSFGAHRIGHGINSIKDESLIERIIKDNITLEVCIQSNIDTKAFPENEAHPIKKLYDMGVHVTLNTDNRTVSNTTLPHEIELAKSIGFTDDDINKMWEYAKMARFD